MSQVTLISSGTVFRRAVRKSSSQNQTCAGLNYVPSLFWCCQLLKFGQPAPCPAVPSSPSRCCLGLPWPLSLKTHLGPLVFQHRDRRERISLTVLMPGPCQGSRKCLSGVGNVSKQGKVTSAMGTLSSLGWAGWGEDNWLCVGSQVIQFSKETAP